jgi:Rps23 Pro-64 3,4-dihydroxylase Tpa1-like proline 4-hydroxylase
MSGIFAADSGIEAATRMQVSADLRCPHIIFRNVMGAEYVEALLGYVADRQDDFQPAHMHNRKTGHSFVDLKVRDCLIFKDLGAFKNPIKSFIVAISGQVLEALHLIELNVEPKEFEIIAYGDGGHIADHVDLRTGTERVRVLSCVYYFATTPRQFGGGELRLFGFPKRSVAGAEPPPLSFVDVEPDTDTLIVFPSWLRHKVLPVRVPSGAWADRRFTINCWVNRVGSSGDL